jgi:hypothetical protein
MILALNSKRRQIYWAQASQPEAMPMTNTLPTEMTAPIDVLPIVLIAP